MEIGKQLNMLEQTAGTEFQQTAGVSGWIAWMANKLCITNNKEDGKTNIICVEEAPIPEAKATMVIEKTIYGGEDVGRPSVDSTTDKEMFIKSTSLIDKNTENTPKPIIQCANSEKQTKVIAELRMDNFIMANELSLARDMNYAMKRKMKLMKDNYMVQMENQQAKHDRSVQQMKDDFMKTMANRIKDDESKKEEDIFIKKELCKLKDNFYQMEQKMKRMDDSVLSQNHKFNKAVEKLQANSEVVSTISTTEYSELRADYKKLNHQMENLVASLKYEKQILLKTTGKMTKKIKSINRNKKMKQKDSNKLMKQMKKDVDEVKKLLYFLGSNTLSYILNTASNAKSNARPRTLNIGITIS